MDKKDYSFIYSITFLIIILLIWQIAANNNWINTFNFSSPILIINELKLLFSEGEILPHIKFTFGVSLVGLLTGTFTAILLAFIFSSIKPLGKIFDPILVGLNGLPKLALGPVFIIWFGIGVEAKVVMSAITVFFPVFYNALTGFLNVDIDLINSIKVMGATNWQLIKKVILPSSLPWIAASLKNGASLAVAGTIVGEYLGSTKGMGWMIQAAGGVYNITRVFACLIVLVLLMLLIDRVLSMINNNLLKWQR